MRFLGGLLKFLGILLLLIGTVACTVCCLYAIEDNDPSLYWVGGVVFLSFLFVALGILGTGSALGQVVKLKKRVAQLEQRLWIATSTTPAASVADEKPVYAEKTEVISKPTHAEASVKATKSDVRIKKMRLPIVIGIGAAILLLILLTTFLANKKDYTFDQPPVSQSQPVTSVPIETAKPTPAQPENTDTSAPIQVAELSVGDSLTTSFIDMHFKDIIVEKDIQKSVTIDNVTRITGPEPLDGQKYICLIGTIINTSSKPLPVYDFFTGCFELDGYVYEVSANDCDVLSANGDPESTIDPLMEYEFRIFAAIPDSLAENHRTASFTFGFYDDFDNKDLAYNRAFAENPIAECPYQYFISLK